MGLDGSVESRLSVFYDYSASVAEADPAVRPEHYGTQRDYASILQVVVPANTVLDRAEGFLNEALAIENETYSAFAGNLSVIYDDNIPDSDAIY